MKRIITPSVLLALGFTLANGTGACTSDGLDIEEEDPAHADFDLRDGDAELATQHARGGNVATESLALVAPGAAQRLYFYRAKVHNVVWHPGCGQPNPDGTPCAFGLSITFQRKYADLDYRLSARADNRQKLITIRLDTFSPQTRHLATLTAPQTVALEPSDLQHGIVYKVRVVDRYHHVLYRGEVATFVAP